MTENELDELLNDCPNLYHVAVLGSWSSIRERGLLSTSALLDLYKVEGEEREKIESQRRPESVELTHPTLPSAIIRDQIPMDDAGLHRCLPHHMAPADWYRLLNQKVFFWLTRERVRRLLGAAAYRTKTYQVLDVDARALVDAYKDKIWFCPINSGATKPFPHPRDENTFRRIPDYPYSEWREKRKKGERVVELAVDYSVEKIEQFVNRVVEMRGDTELQEVVL